MKIKTITETCIACPSQWDIITDTGHYIYVRYRWGRLAISITREPIKSIKNGPTDEEWQSMIILYDKVVGDAFDGCMTEEELRTHFNFDDIQIPQVE